MGSVVLWGVNYGSVRFIFTHVHGFFSFFTFGKLLILDSSKPKIYSIGQKLIITKIVKPNRRSQVYDASIAKALNQNKICFLTIYNGCMIQIDQKLERKAAPERLAVCWSVVG